MDGNGIDMGNLSSEVVMRHILIAVLIAVTATSAYAQQHVRGHMRKDGVYVQPHMRSNNDGKHSNNYSATGNYNPYTGKKGNVPDPVLSDPYGLKKAETGYLWPVKR